MQIDTDRLKLRSARPSDAEALHQLFSNPQAMAYWSSIPHATLAETEAWLAAMLSIPDGAGEDFIVEVSGQVAGKAGFYRFPEIGFILHPRYWGRGIAREALAAVIARGFEVHGLPHVEADVDPRNGRSLRLLTSLGFREVGRRTGSWLIGGEVCDSVDLRLSPQDWPRFNPRPARKGS